MAGIIPVLASEIEPFPIRVTEKRLPEMKHYGDVHRLNGTNLEPVDIITFGSPCQDLSIAGKRSGLGGSRSGLFYEAVRIIIEMRRNTNGKYPRWAVWENVPGALSSQHGQDFRCVLESLIRIKDPAADVPLPESGRWLHAGEILGECCRLQGYPDGWCENLESPAPSNKETDRWEAIFEEWRTVMGGKTKPKTRRQIIRWLQNPHTDSAEYKAYGNSVAVPCVFFVLAGIVWAQETEVNELEND